uniref:DUS-like FMN-binding domain-containing protein n=1 Tax=Nelumbo nucifera TaxID=4432 RepID=A0A822Z921_NELNU|nr:TPA_asm: hypothetical protein HUJ06_015670 [Nelumbo nucifera]
MATLSTQTDSLEDLDDRLCAEETGCCLLEQNSSSSSSSTVSFMPSESPFSCYSLGSPACCLNVECRIERAWAHWKKLGQPKLMVAPMVDNSELPFRMLCRKYGANAAYTPMLHSRIFFWTMRSIGLRNSPPARCSQRIAKRGNYGAFLMDKLPLVKSLVHKLASNLHVPVSCKIRIFPNLEDTITYARMLEDAGCSLLAVHGRTRDEKDGKKFRADWNAIKAVKGATRIPVLANGNIRHIDDVQRCLEETGADGVLSAESLLENPALFAGYLTAEWVEGDEESNVDGEVDQTDLLVCF